MVTAFILVNEHHALKFMLQIRFDNGDFFQQFIPVCDNIVTAQQ